MFKSCKKTDNIFLSNIIIHLWIRALKFETS